MLRKSEPVTSKALTVDVAIEASQEGRNQMHVQGGLRPCRQVNEVFRIIA